MKIFTNRKRLQFYLCLGTVWLLLWLFNSFINHQRTFATQSLNEIWQVSYLVFVNYIFFEYSLPFIRRKRSNSLFNILIGVLLTAIHLALVSFGLYAWNLLGIALHVYTQFRYTILFPDNFINRLIDAAYYEAQSGIASVFFFGVAKLFHHNIILRQTAQQMQLEKQEAELNFLKSQTNPHFLFNTLNNIYALAREKSDLAPESILRLSKILRFMLYETNGAFINVEQELEIISDYIELEKLRYDDSLRINFKHEIEDLKQPLPPLLLIPLIENAFKHGVAETGDQAFVDIQLVVDRQQLSFVVKNSAEKSDGEKQVKENIGLSNLRRQLQLLYTDYNLAVSRNETDFSATLRINLASHV
jgi:two-component system LytT family sensor kinase